jgi:exosortase/archaeosortase family protein
MYSRILQSLFSYQMFFAIGVVILAAHPVIWLINTWIDPAYGSHGWLVFLLAALLFVWSATSQRRWVTTVSRRRALWLLAMTAAVRLIGQLIGVNVIGALALVLDVYAIGLLFELNARTRALSPGWLALLFAFALPLERIVQRTIGFGLQHASAAGACGVLKTGFDAVQCEGVRILLAGKDVLVDLPCSGAQGLLLLLLLFSVLSALIQPTLRQAALGFGITLVAAVVTNVMRISVLAIGLAYPDSVGVVDVMASPWHEAIGLMALGLGGAPVLLWAMHTPRLLSDPPFDAAQIRFPLFQPRQRTRFAALAFLLAAIFIASLHARPVDVARKISAPKLPQRIGDFYAVPGHLSNIERHYFTRYGGGAARANYGPYSLLVVSTSAPLRHLHAPDECLAGAGHKVRYRGMTRQPLPTAVYRSEDPNGNRWRVAVTFISDRGEIATSVAEAVWRWLQEPDATWSMVQRIAPWQASVHTLAAWDAAVVRAMDLSVPQTRVAPAVVTHSQFYSIQSDGGPRHGCCYAKSSNPFFVASRCSCYAS